MPLSPRDIAEIERAHTDGLSSRQIIEVLAEHGEHLTEATLRKYVQLGLLPRSRRVGEKGKHRGSRGIYPVEVVRRIDEIRRAMTSGDTLESLARATQAVRAKLASVRVSLSEALEAAQTDLHTRELDRTMKSSLRSELALLSKQSTTWLRSMEKWASSLQDAATPPKLPGKVLAEKPAARAKAPARASSPARAANGGPRENGSKSAARRSRRPGGM